MSKRKKSWAVFEGSSRKTRFSRDKEKVEAKRKPGQVVAQEVVKWPNNIVTYIW